jgi:phosphate transport system permease protein
MAEGAGKNQDTTAGAPAKSAGVGASFNARERKTPLATRGEPMVWITGAALALCAVMVVALLAIVLAGGSATFWPRPIERVTLRALPGQADGQGTVLLGTMVRAESYEPGAEERRQIDELKKAGKLSAAALDDDGQPVRRLYRIGNKEVRSQPFQWVPVHSIATSTLEPDATLLERAEWGVWTGYPAGVVVQREVEVAGPASAVKLAEGAKGDARRVERAVLRELEGGKLLVRERTIFDASPKDSMAKFREVHAEALERRTQIEDLKTHAVGRVNRALEHERLRVRKAELDLQRAMDGQSAGLLGSMGAGARGAVAVVAGVLGLACLAGVIVFRGNNKPVEQGFLPEPDKRGAIIRIALLGVGVMLVLMAYLENPWTGSGMTRERLDALRAEAGAKVEQLNGEYAKITDEIARIDREDAQWRVLFTEPQFGKFAPIRQTELDEPLRVSQIVRAVQPNEMGVVAKLGVYLDRWGEFLFGLPREANTEGGVFPVIFGTVTLTLLLSVVVVPLGVVAALYLREYAKQGPLTSAIRIAINNLAGVPSIVYGVFGLGFFCYTVGQYVDTGSGVLAGEPGSLFGAKLPMRAVALWWLGVLALVALVVGTVVVGGLSKPLPGKHASRVQENLGKIAFGAWVLAAFGALALVAYTPYFRGFYEAAAPSPTFGTKGMLWSAATLALLTLPVVIVATEEAIAAVPRTMREGSYGCGASKWQTIQRIVLPRAMPGIMTGMILAMARGAGEVAPLMLVGAVKLAPELPVDGSAPFLHLERPFMHLGFHIYDVGFQSPDSEAARPIVWCTTLLLIVVVVALNITAIRVRAGLRKKFLGEAF